MNLPAAETENRKADHLRICIEEDVQFQQTTTGLEKYRFTHSCLPELDYQEISLNTTFLNKPLGAPLLISSMTGGTDYAKTINQRLAEVAQYYKIAMGVGSQRVAIENPQVINTFNIRKIAPDCLLFANLGAVQLNYTYGIEQCRRVVEMLEANALILHLNPLQEAVQTKGDTNFKGILDKIHKLCTAIEVPVIAKEVGNGINPNIATKLIEAGISALDVAGAGGTSWASVEGKRAQDWKQKRLGQTFADWGIPTAECLTGIRKINPNIPLIASGGLKNGLDVAKCLALGADLAGLAWVFLQAAAESPEALHQLVEILTAEIKTVLFCTGTPNLPTLKNTTALQQLG